MLSSSPRTSTLISSVLSSSAVTGENRGSREQALTAFWTISSAMLFSVAMIVPIQPLSRPCRCRETKVPACLVSISFGSPSGRMMRS